ncbi:hypothetical protein FNF27_06345 [Cafeteria roenbergensis]|uniref:Fibronectin type-III domain-containing protein n=2 Tax=Cafeteria roenbergensis TaxID=33653 RepID=A0A5A8E0D6_CAFRO|nr:hypothetical protein FNF27_06345 [Cafeteria roenbergensis]
MGFGPWSPPSLPVTTLGAPPMPPTPPVLEARSDSIVTVGWRPTRANGYVVDLFELQVAEAASGRDVPVAEADLGAALDEDYDGFVRAEMRRLSGPTSRNFNWTSVTMECEEQSYMVTSLRPATEYVFRVRARTEAGWGAFSSASEVIATRRRAM